MIGSSGAKLPGTLWAKLHSVHCEYFHVSWQQVESIQKSSYENGVRLKTDIFRISRGKDVWLMWYKYSFCFVHTNFNMIMVHIDFKYTVCSVGFAKSIKMDSKQKWVIMIIFQSEKLA